MQASSASTLSADPYRAGCELGAALAKIRPEVVFLFSSIQYGGSGELLEGLYDGIGYNDVVVIGNTGDGFYEAGEVGDLGAAALGLSSGGTVRWLITHDQGAKNAPAQTTRSVLDKMHGLTGPDKPAFMFLVSDFRADSSEIEKVIGSETDVPVIGGLAADDNQMHACSVYANREVLHDSIALLAAVGPVNYRIVIENSLTPVGMPGLVDSAEGAHVHRIDGISAMDFIERETGKPVLQSDRGVTSLAIIDGDRPDIKRLRSIVPDFSASDRSLGLYGGIEAGKRVQVCLAQPEQVLRELYLLVEKCRQEGFHPSAALIVSCAGRKWLLGDRIQHEINALQEQFGTSLPIAGFPSFGEIGPLPTIDGYSRNLVHNMTYVLMLFGDTATPDL